MKQLEHPFLGGAVQVDEQVAAHHQTQFGKRRVAQQVVWHKQHQIAQLFFDPVGVALAHEKTLQALWGHVYVRRLVVAACSSKSQGRFVDVAGKNLQFGRVGQLLRRLEQQHSHRVGFLATGAARHPHPHAVLGRFAQKKLWNHLVLEHCKGFGVTEEVGDGDKQVLQQRLHFLEVCSEQIEVGVQVRQFVNLHAAGDAPPQGGALVKAEIVSSALPHQF